MSNNCEGCYHDGCCGYFSELNTYNTSIPEENQKAFEEFCCGCCCGDGVECNRDQGCDNYENKTNEEIYMNLYQLKNGDIFTISSKRLFDVLSMSNQHHVFKPLKHYKKIIWYKPKTWFRKLWKIQYIEIGKE